MRYTHKLDKPDGNCNYFLIPDQKQCDNAENKLGQLEDIEEELGIDLLTLFKALSGEYAVKEDDGRIVVEWSCPRFYAPACLGHGFDSWISIRNKENEKVLYLKDYGKTWALTKEELL